MIDEGEELQYESINLYFPLPYRILAIAIAGVWLFALNLHYFHIVRIDASLMLRYTRTQNEPLLYRSVYQVATLLTTIFTANLLLFLTLTHGDPVAVGAFELIPMTLFGIFLGLLLWPTGGSWHKRGRSRILCMFRRILVGGLDPDLRFADILLADALTSYAKALGDLATTFCQFLSGYSATNPIPSRVCGGPLVVPFLIALPYACRLRQCLIEYSRATRHGAPPAEWQPHLYNAAKYASAFPVVLFSALQRDLDPAAAHAHTLQHAWWVAVVFNSAFSFWWDVTRDWDLTLLTARRSGSGNGESYPWGLRAVRHFLAVEFYYGAIAIDLLLRATWCAKLSPHLARVNDIEAGLFGLEFMEVVRRWVWVFFRVEKEFVATTRGSGGHGGVGLLAGIEDLEGGIMMNDMNEYQD